MKFSEIAIFLILLSGMAFAAENCTAASDQCAAAENYFLSDSSGTQKTAFNEGENVYINFDVRNIGLSDIAGLQLFTISSNLTYGENYLDGQYSVPVPNGQNILLRVGEVIHFGPVPIIPSAHSTTAEYEIQLFVSSSSNYYFRKLAININYVRNPSSGFGTAIQVLFENIKINGIPYNESTPQTIEKDTNFTLSFDVKNLSADEPKTIQALQSTDGFCTPNNLMTWTISAGSIQPQTVTCNIPETRMMPQTRLRYYFRTTDDKRLWQIWPLINIGTNPQIRYNNIYSDFGSIIANNSTTVFIDFKNTGLGAIAADSKIQLEVWAGSTSTTLTNQIASTEIILPEIAAGQNFVAQYPFTPTATYPAFKIRSKIVDPSGNQIYVEWGGTINGFTEKIYSERTPINVNFSTDCSVIQIVDNKKTYSCDVIATGNQLVSFPTNDILNFSVNPDATMPFYKTGSETIYYASFGSNETKKTFNVTVLIPMDDLNEIEGIAAIAIVLTIFGFLLKKSKPF